MSPHLPATVELRILLVSTSLGMGGADNQVFRLACGLQDRGHRVRLVSMVTPGPIGELAARSGIPVESLGMARGIPDPRALLAFARMIRREQPQVLHSHLIHANLLARLVRVIAPVPIVVCTVHSIWEGRMFRELAYRLTDRLCDLTTQVSYAGAERYVRVNAVPPGKIQVIPNGVDTRRFRPDPQARDRVRSELQLGQEFTWLAVGRFEVAKDYPNLLQAFAQVAARREDATLIVAGGGTLRDEVERLAGSLGLTRRVRFLGIRQDIPDLMNAADAYVLASAWEGMPVVLLEAAACGLPAVATDIGGCSEVVRPGETGYLVPPRTPEALAQAMLHIMALTPAERRAMGAAARARVEAHYSLEKMIDRWEALYRTLLENRGCQAAYKMLSP